MVKWCQQYQWLVDQLIMLTVGRRIICIDLKQIRDVARSTPGVTLTNLTAVLKWSGLQKIVGSNKEESS
jgi:hypothetical protein